MPTPISHQHLPASAYRIGQRVRMQRDETAPALLGTLVHLSADGFQIEFDADRRAGYAHGSYSQLKPILKPLTRLSDEAARECYRLAFALTELLFATLTRYSNRLTLDGESSTLEVYFDGRLSAYRVIAGRTRPDHRPLAINAVAALDYLDGEGYDTRGYLATGLAVEEAETVTNELI